MMMNYLMRGSFSLKQAFLFGTGLYIILFLLLLRKKERRTLSWKNLWEWLFCVYGMTVLDVTGVSFWDYQIVSGSPNWNLVPFVGGAIVPILLNFLLFVPCGVLLPLAFRRNWTWWKALLLGGGTSFLIELLQLFGGRCADIDDLLMNAFGTLAGYVLYTCAVRWREHPRQSGKNLAALCLISALAFGGIYLLCERTQIGADGLEAIDQKEVRMWFYHDEQWIEGDVDGGIFLQFSTNLNNCGGHVLTGEAVEEREIWSEEDYYIVLTFDTPQTIRFENAPEFVLSDVEELRYNTTENILYWYSSHVWHATDYTRLDEELEPHREEVLKWYGAVNQLVEEEFD